MIEEILKPTRYTEKYLTIGCDYILGRHAEIVKMGLAGFSITLLLTGLVPACELKLKYTLHAILCWRSLNILYLTHYNTISLYQDNVTTGELRF